MTGIGLRLAGAAERQAGGLARDRGVNVGSSRFALATPSEGLAAEWAGLAGRAAEDNLFFHPDFALPAMRAFGGGVRLAMVRGADGELIAAAPVTVTRLGRIAPAARLWSHDYGPLGVPLIDRNQVETATAALIEGLASAASSVSLVLPDMPLDGAIAAAARNAAGRAGRPVAVLDAHVRAMLQCRADGNADLRAALPARRRKEFARQMRRLAELGPVAVETAREAHAVAARFEEFLTLEAAGWKGKRHTALASRAATAEFGRAVVRNRAASRTARIVSIRLGAEPIAMVVCFVEGATAYTWKIAHDERYARFSPGAQLMLEVGQGFSAYGEVERIDSCAAADHPMIDHLWKDRLSVGTIVIGPVGGSTLHRLGLAAAAAEIKARAAYRRLRARLAPSHSKETE